MIERHYKPRHQSNSFTTKRIVIAVWNKFLVDYRNFNGT